MPGLGLGADFLLGDKKSLSCDSALENVVFRRIDAVNAACQNRDGGELHCAGVGRRVDASGEARHDGETGLAQFRRKGARESDAGTGRVTGTDHRHGGAAEQVRVTLNRDQRRRVRHCGKGVGIQALAVREQPGAGPFQRCQFIAGLAVAGNAKR